MSKNIKVVYYVDTEDNTKEEIRLWIDLVLLLKTKENS